MPRKMKEKDAVENNEKKENVDTGFMNTLERKRQLRKHRRGWKDINKLDRSA